MEQQEPTSRLRKVSSVATSLALAAVALTAIAEVMMFFGDLGPGETQASRESLALWGLAVGGTVAVILIALSWLTARRTR